MTTPLPQDLTAAVEREDHSHEAGLRAKRVRPPRSVQRQKQLCVSMDRDTLREIDDAATAERLTRSEWVRQRLEWALMGDPA